MYLYVFKFVHILNCCQRYLRSIIYDLRQQETSQSHEMKRALQLKRTRFESWPSNF
jgi:hypothetical protein